MKLSEMTTTRPPKILLFGPYGSAKTSWALTLGDRAMVYDIDDGAVVGKGLFDKFRDLRLNCNITRCVDDDPRKASAFMKLKSYIFEAADKVRAGKFPQQVIVIDSLTSMMNHALRFVMQNGSKLTFNVAGNDSQPEIQHWGIAFREIENLLMICRSMTIPFVLIAHENRETLTTGSQAQNTLSTQTIVEVGIQGKSMPGKVAGQFDEVWYPKVQIVSGKLELRIQTLQNSIIRTRSRLGLADGIDVTNKTMTEVIESLGYKFPPLPTPPVAVPLPQSKGTTGA